MTHIYGTTAYDTREIADLRDVINTQNREHDAEKSAFSRKNRQLCDQYAQLLIDRRPAYPTAEHVRGIEEIARIVHGDLSYGDHLGHPRNQDRAAGLELPPSVCFCSTVARINIYARAPYRPDSGARLWEITDDEITAIRRHLARLSLHVVTQWVHDDGVAFIVTSRKV
ncbi:hypothetical protein [Streptomyces sp. NPDC052042]|uniref:hypothetical protein n=1 Tax=Streptomyces sp. NPDC052042 TaxID=3365683 RepID=UPI0037D87F36